MPDCNLLNPAAQDSRAAGGDLCGATPGNFGQSVITTQIDPAILSGWGVRPSDWNLMMAVQHEVLPRVSVEVGYYRRWFHGFFVTDNLNLALSDFTPFNLTAPLDSRLPDGGGYTVGPLYDVTPGKFSVAPNNWIFSTDQYGTQTLYWHGVDVNVSARTGLFTFQGGTSTGKTFSDFCEIRAKVPEWRPLDPNCRFDLPFRAGKQFETASTNLIGVRCGRIRNDDRSEPLRNGRHREQVISKAIANRAHSRLRLSNVF